VLLCLPLQVAYASNLTAFNTNIVFPQLRFIHTRDCGAIEPNTQFGEE